jgi:5-(carboxyamino)imidazole ribonucleotide mutase
MSTRPQPLVGILYGSESDRELVDRCEAVLRDELGIPCETRCLSAHRMPEATREYARSARERGLRVLIAIAGMAAHLPGVVASHTTLPVLGVPAGAGALLGMDALLSMVQMPAGVPVGTLAVGSAGARNAALLAARILALQDDRVAERLAALARRMEEGGRI